MSLVTAVGCSFGKTSASDEQSSSQTSETTDTSSVEEKEEAVISLYVDNDDLTLAVAGTKQLRVDVENGSKKDVVFEVVSGAATVSATGLLTVSEEAEVGAKIKVVAKIGDVSSNELEFTVSDAVATTIELTPSAETISKGGAVTFTATFTPDYATTTDYTLTIEGKGAEFAEIVDGALKIKDDAQLADIHDKEIRVKATLNANNAVLTYVFITVKAEAAITYLSCETLNIVASRDSNKSIITEAYNWNGDEMEVAANELTYEVANENVATVDENGRVTVKGHGSTVVTVKYGQDASAECVINVMVAPESIQFANINANMAKVSEIHYGKGEGNYLNLGVACETKDGYTASTQAVTYKFEAVESGVTEGLATVTENGISFNETGKIRVTVVSNSSVAGYEVSEQYEVKKSIIINVNEGVNLYTLDDLKAYQSNDYAGKPANFLAGINITDDNYVGVDDQADYKYGALSFFGSRTLYGNGNAISLLGLSSSETGKANIQDFMRFRPLGNNPLSVEVYDLDFIGNLTVQGKHIDGTDLNRTDGNTGVTDNYLSAIEISGLWVGEYGAGSAKNAYVEKAIVKNVNIQGFSKALRFEHAVSALVENVEISNCYANGIENVQSHLTVKDVTVKQVGAFAIEVSSDDMRGDKDPTVMPSGTAGKQYNETATIKYEGYFDCQNPNNGASTVYMTKLGAAFGTTIATLVQAAAQNLIQEISSDAAVQGELMNVLGQTMMNPTTGELNFATLVFVNPMNFQQYMDKGNTEGKFCEFATTEKINVKDLLTNCLADKTYDISEKKYLIIDLANLPLMGMKVNLGQIILMNLAYNG